MNEALISLVEDFGLMPFLPLAVEDRASMASLVQAIDRASGYVFLGARATDEEGRTLEDEASVWAQAMSEQWVGKMDVRDVQERWIDRKEELDEEERRMWEAEAREAGALPEQTAAAVVRKDVEKRGAEYVEDEEGLEAEQKKWEEGRKTAGDGGGGVKVVHKG